MIELNGKFQKAKVFTNLIDNESISQIINLLNQEAFKHSKVRIMPDVHAGKGCVIGFTADLGEYVIPNLIGVDIGCGMLTTNLGKKDIDLGKLDNFIKTNIPHGFSVSDDIPNLTDSFKKNIKSISEKTSSSFERNLKSIGSLGGGNHFIEISKSNDGTNYLIIHSGSRNFGLQVAKHHQKIAEESLDNNRNFLVEKKKEIINLLKSQGREDAIEAEISKITKPAQGIPKELAYLIGDKKSDYIKDMKVAMEFASLSRKVMRDKILNHLDLNINSLSTFETIHNYIGNDNIIRKGAISANKDEIVLIPINMKDGCIIAKGKGNADWNLSAPHGAGRLLSRGAAKNSLNLEDFKNEMRDIYSSCISEQTLDESPMAYKPISSILDNISDTVEVLEIIKPIYNFKA